MMIVAAIDYVADYSYCTTYHLLGVALTPLTASPTKEVSKYFLSILTVLLLSVSVTDDTYCL